MKKSIFFLFTSFFCLFLLPISSEASSEAIKDQDELFTTEEIKQLSQEIDRLEETTKAKIFILTDNSNTFDSQRTADNFMLDQIGKDANGITFYIDMNQRTFVISTSGNMIDYFTDKRIEHTLDEMEPSMRNSQYYEAAESYLSAIESYYEEGIPGGHYRIDTETGKVTRYRTLTTTEMIIALVLSIILSILFFIISISKYQLKLGTYKYPFREKSSLSLTKKNDHLIHSFVTTRRIPRNNSSSGGSGGGSSTHSTGGGTFGGGSRGF